jgi:hypothetical protein
VSTIRVNREFAAFLALTSLVWAQGCYVYRRPTEAVAPGAVVRVRSRTPFVVQAGGPAAVPPVTECRATYIEGVVDTTTADTLAFRRVKWVWPAARADSSCLAIKRSAVVVPPDQARVAVRHYSGGRTLLFVVGVSIVSFVAIAAATWDQGYWSSGGCWICD